MPQAEFILAVRMWLAIPIFSNLTHVLHVCAVKLLTNLETTSLDVVSTLDNIELKTLAKDIRDMKLWHGTYYINYPMRAMLL